MYEISYRFTEKKYFVVKTKFSLLTHLVNLFCQFNDIFVHLIKQHLTQHLTQTFNINNIISMCVLINFD